MTDEELIQLLKNPPSPGEFTKAFDLLYQRYFQRLYLAVRRMLPRSAVSLLEDILQDSWIKIANKIELFQTGTNFGGWASTIATNTARDALKKKQLARLPEEIDPAAPKEQLPILVAEESLERQQSLTQCMEHLSVNERNVIEQRLSGASPQEIATTASLSTARVYSIWSESTKKLRDCIQRRLSA